MAKAGIFVVLFFLWTSREVWGIGTESTISIDIPNQTATNSQTTNDSSQEVYTLEPTVVYMTDYETTIKADTTECQFLDVAFVLDASGSITSTPDWLSVIEFTKRFVRFVPVGEEFLQIGVLYFKLNATLFFDTDDYNQKDDILSRLDELKSVPAGGDTNITAGLELLNIRMFPSIVDGRNATRVAILITDGASKVSIHDVTKQARIARDSGITLFAVGVGIEINRNELYNITDDPKKVIEIAEFDQIMQILIPLIEDVCHYNECSSSPCLNVATCVDDINGYSCNCTSGWDGIHCEIDIDECASSPCQNEGTCTEWINGYTCSCDSGWIGNYCEHDINECPNVECHNGGSCTNLPGTFACICQEDFAGEFCEDSIKFHPIISNVYPLFGPIAGGTMVNVTGEHFISARVMKLGDIECKIIDENLENWIVAKTPPATPTNIGKPLMVSVVFFGGLEIPAHADYRYRPNPKIEAIYPLETISRGGTKLTVNGTHMDSVAEPVLEVTLETRMITENETALTVDLNKDFPKTNVTFSGGECDIDSPTHLHCIVPPMEIHILQNATCGAEKTKKPCIELKLFVGMIMDDVSDFKNISQHPNLAEYGLLTVFDPPTFPDETKDFEYKKGSPIVIQGHNLLRGSTADDYSVRVGEMNGTQLTVTDNAISFHPPTIDKLFFTTQTLEIVVNVGTNYPNYVGNVKYKTILLIVVISAVVVGLVFIIVPPSVVCHRRKKKPKTKTNDKNAAVFDGDLIHLPPITVDNSMDGTDDIRMPYVRNDLQEHASHPEQDNPMFDPSMFSSFTPISKESLEKGSSNYYPIKPSVYRSTNPDQVTQDSMRPTSGDYRYQWHSLNSINDVNAI